MSTLLEKKSKGMGSKGLGPWPGVRGRAAPEGVGLQTTAEWRQYEAGVSYLRGRGVFAQTDKNYRFYSGDQWHGASLGEMPAPVLNVIRPAVDYKVAVVAQSGVSLQFSPANHGDEAFMPAARAACARLNAYAARLWETTDMDSRMWRAALDCAIAGDAALYFYYDNGEVAAEAVDCANICLGDEQETELQNQPYVIVAFRRQVSAVREEARANGAGGEAIAAILPDGETRERVGDAAKLEVETRRGGSEGEESQEGAEGKCLCLLKLWKQGGTVWMKKSTRCAVYCPETDTRLTRYPLAMLTWNEIKGSARGRGEVQPMIANQLEINKTAARRAVAIMQTAYPKLVYNKNRVSDVAALTQTGAAIGVEDGSASDIRMSIDYLRPGQISPDAKLFLDEMLRATQELSGAGAAAMGIVNPERASGAAILAVKDAAAAPLSPQAAKFRRFAEDIGRVWADLWRANAGGGLQVVYEEGGAQRAEVIPQAVMERLIITVKVDVSPANPFSKFAQEQMLENFLQAGHITFEEYVAALPDDAAAPKVKLARILQERRNNEQLIIEN